MFLIPKSYWQVKKTKEKGRGVFATKDIAPGQILGDYIGTFIHVDEEEKYEKKYGFYSMYYSTVTSVFPDIQKEGVHIINHSCAPNCGFYIYKGHIIYFSLRKIFKGEELSISYQLSPQDKDCNPCIHLCYCESFVCNQTWHLSKNRYDKWEKFDDWLCTKTPTKRARLGKEVPVLSDYPQEIPDYSIYTLFGSPLKKPVVYSDTVLPAISELRKRIRETGRYAAFKNLEFTVYGILDNLLITKI